MAREVAKAAKAARAPLSQVTASTVVKEDIAALIASSLRQQTKAARFKRKDSKGNGKGNKGNCKSLEYVAIDPGAEAPEPEREDSE